MLQCCAVLTPLSNKQKNSQSQLRIKPSCLSASTQESAFDICDQQWKKSGKKSRKNPSKKVGRKSRKKLRSNLRKRLGKKLGKHGEKKVVIGEKNVEKGIFQHEICMALNEW